MRVFAVIPAYHEAERLPGVLDAIAPHVEGMVVVDDGSRDETASVVTHPKAVVLRHPLNRGQGAALRTGTVAALELGADVIVHVDADGQHDPEGIARVVAPICDGSADVVLGSRFLTIRPEGMPSMRRVLLMGVRQFNRWVVGIPGRVTDPQSGFRAFSAMAARQIDFQQDRMAHASEILRLVTRSSLRWQEVPVRVRYTEDSLRKGQKATDAFKVAWQLVLGAFHRS
ncbi:glycosyltransferase family 2 protein [Patescibacteria group bacterium]|nr:glycosyltransferase family 2 protein [Patescibacteria group bacterium]